MEKIQELFDRFLPEGILEYFEYAGYERNSEKASKPYGEVTIILEEKNVVPKLPEAYHLSMYFRNCYEYQNKKYRFEEWIEKIESTTLREMKVAAQTIKRHPGGIKNYFENKATNAAIESFILN